MESALERFLRALLNPISAILVAMRVPAHGVTIFGGVLCMAGCLILLTLDDVLAGVAVIGVGLVCDLLDGLVARTSGTDSRLGELIDSLVDRFVESVVYLSAAWCYFTLYNRAWETGSALALYTLSYLCSYAAIWCSPDAPRAAPGPISRGGRLTCLLASLTLVSTGWDAAGDAVLVLAIAASVRTLQLRIMEAVGKARSE